MRAHNPIKTGKGTEPGSSDSPDKPNMGKKAPSAFRNTVVQMEDVIKKDNCLRIQQQEQRITHVHVNHYKHDLSMSRQAELQTFAFSSLQLASLLRETRQAASEIWTPLRCVCIRNVLWMAIKTPAARQQH